MAAEQCKGAGNVFIEVWPFSELDTATKEKLQTRLNHIASVCLYSNGRTVLCGDDEEPGETPQPGGEVFVSRSAEAVKSKKGGCGCGDSGSKTSGDTVSKGGDYPTDTAPKHCCQFYEMGTKVRPYQKIKFAIDLKFLADAIPVAVTVEFDLQFSAEATGVVKNWLCPKACQRDTTSASVDLLVKGTFKPRVAIPGFGFDAGLAYELDVRLGMGDFLNTCDL